MRRADWSTETDAPGLTMTLTSKQQTHPAQVRLLIQKVEESQHNDGKNLEASQLKKLQAVVARAVDTIKAALPSKRLKALQDHVAGFVDLITGISKVDNLSTRQLRAWC
jgi:hypothetical protein